MSYSDSEQIIHMKKIQAEGLELFIRKNADYGDSYKQHGLVGVLVRLQDKINRAMHVSKHSICVNESLRDTLIDLHNYAAMAIMESEPLSLPIRTYGSEPPSVPTPYEDHCINSEPLSLPIRTFEPLSDMVPVRSSMFDPDLNHCINLRD